MPAPSPEPLYTLSQARHILALEECRAEGCDMYRIVTAASDHFLGVLVCRRCGTPWYPQRPPKEEPK